MNGEKHSAVFDAALVALRLVFRNSQSDERADEPTDCAANSETRKCSHDRPRCDEWADTRNCKCTDACK